MKKLFQWYVNAPLIWLNIGALMLLEKIRGGVRHHHYTLNK